MRRMRVVPALFVCGLLTGVFLPNLVETSALRMTCLSDLMMLRRYLSEPVDGGDLLGYLLQSRGIFWGLCGVLGISIFGVPFSLFCTVMLGFTTGGILASSILAGGMGGFFLGIGMLLPQCLMYLPAGLLLYQACYQMSAKCWRNARINQREYRGYFLHILWLWGLLLAGMILESYVNPGVIRMILENVSFF